MKVLLTKSFKDHLGRMDYVSESYPVADRNEALTLVANFINNAMDFYTKPEFNLQIEIIG